MKVRSLEALFGRSMAMATPFVSGELDTVEGNESHHTITRTSTFSNGASREDTLDDSSGTQLAPSNAKTMSSDDVPLPSGVFTLLTDCYSPTCSRDFLCYSIACPRRLEQQARLNIKPQPGLKRSISKESLGDLVVIKSDCY